MRRAFTVVEVALAAAIASVVLVVLWQVFSSAHRESVDAERRLQAVAALQRLSQALEADLSLLAPGDGAVQVTDRGAGLSFQAAHVDAKAAPGEGLLTFSPLVYRLDRGAHTVLRTAAAATRALPGVRLLDLRFALTPRLVVGAPPAPVAPDCLLVQAVWAPTEDLIAGRTPRAQDVVSLSLSFGLAHLSDDERFPGWVTNPTSRARVTGE